MIELTGVTKTVQSGTRPLTILHPLDLAVPKGACLAIVGPSGSGKSTLLGLIAGLDAPTAGRIVVDGVEITGNPLLTDISGLSAIGTLTGANPAVSGAFTVTGNATLCDSHVSSVMATIASLNGGNLNTAFLGGWTVSNAACGGQQEQ